MRATSASGGGSPGRRRCARSCRAPVAPKSDAEQRPRTPARRAGSSPPSRSADRESGRSASSHGFAGRAGICARRSAIEPPVKRGAAHSGSGLGHQCCSTPTWTTASAAPTSIDSTTSASSARAHRRGTTQASRPSTIATRYGQRSSRQSAQGTRPSHRSDASASPSAKRRGECAQQGDVADAGQRHAGDVPCFHRRMQAVAARRARGLGSRHPGREESRCAAFCGAAPRPAT